MKMDNPIREKIEETIWRYQMLARGERVLVAVSGGPDSVALLHILNLLKGKLGIELVVGHINHQLRARESDEDEEFVRNMCAKLNLKFLSRSVDVSKNAERKKLSIEDCARQMRYHALEVMASKAKANKIATGHTSDDQAETVLMRLIRGAGPLGLCGIPAVRGQFIRPLIDLEREEIENFLKENLLEWRVDWSNFKMDYLRNRVRLKLLSLIKREFNSNIVEVLSRTAQLLSWQKEFLGKEIEKSFKRATSSQGRDKIVLDLKKMIAYDIYLRTNIVRYAFSSLGGSPNPPSFSTIQQVLDLVAKRKLGKKVKLGKGIWVEVCAHSLTIYKKKKKPSKPCGAKLPGDMEARNLKLKSEVIAREKLPAKIKSYDQWVAYLDWERLIPPFVLRHRRNKDRFMPLGLLGSKSLADFLMDAKVPKMARDEIFLLTSKNRIAWVIGHRIDDRFKVTSQTKEVLKIQAQQDPV